jgi:hypothetical protein
MRIPWRTQQTPLAEDVLEVAASADGAVKVSVEKIGGSLPVDRDEAERLARRYLDALEASRAAEQALKNVEDDIKDMLGHNAELVEDGTGRVLFSWTASVREVLDSKALAADKPSLVEQYRRATASRSFRQHLTTRVSKYATN